MRTPRYSHFSWRLDHPVAGGEPAAKTTNVRSESTLFGHSVHKRVNSSSPRVVGLFGAGYLPVHWCQGGHCDRVMADRFENGDTANDNGGLGGPAGVRLRPDEKGLLQRRRPRRACSNDRLHPGPGHHLDLADAELQEQGGPARGRSVGRLPRLLDHRLHPDRPAPRHQRRAARAGRRRPRARHEGLLRHHHQPHRRRDRLRGGRPQPLRLQGRRALPDGRPARPSTTATTPARNTFPALDPTTSFPYTPVLDPAEQNLKVPAWLNDVTLYHNRGDTTFVGENSYYGDFFGLDDLFTENPTRGRRDDRHLQDLDRATSASTASGSTP